jgi:hypothetical protein
VSTVERFEARKLEKRLQRCIHFTGIQHDRCAAGVDYMSVRDLSVRPARFPCTNSDAVTKCVRRELPTREQVHAEMAEENAAIEAFLTKLRDGICPHCGKKPDDFEQVGHCVYARPCGHRIGQGNAEEYKAGLRTSR